MLRHTKSSACCAGSLLRPTTLELSLLLLEDADQTVFAAVHGGAGALDGLLIEVPDGLKVDQQAEAAPRLRLLELWRALRREEETSRGQTWPIPNKCKSWETGIVKTHQSKLALKSSSANSTTYI